MARRAPEDQSDGSAAPISESPSSKSGWFSDGPLRRLLANASLLAGGRTLNALFNLAAMTLIVRNVGLEIFGTLVLIHATMKTISDVSKFQSWQSVLRFGTPAFEQNRTMDFRRLVKLTVMLDLGSALFGITVAVIATPLLASRFGWSPEWIPVIQAYAISILFMVTATPMGLLRLFDRFDLLSVSNAIGSFVRVLGAFWLVAFGGGLEFLLLVWFASTMANGLWLIGHSIRALVARDLLTGPRLGYRGLTLGHKGISKFLLNTQANSTLLTATSRFPTVVIGLLLTPSAVALYSIAGQVVSIVSNFGKVMKPAIYPELARLETRNDLREIRRLLVRSMVLMAAAGSVIVAPLILFGRLLLGFIFGPEAVDAYELVVVLAVNSILALVAFPLAPALISMGYAGTVLKVRLASVTVFLIALFTLIPQFGLIGAGAAGLAGELVLITGHIVALVAVLGSLSEKETRLKRRRESDSSKDLDDGGSIESG